MISANKKAAVKAASGEGGDLDFSLIAISS
jgi:hypothetical protein